MKTVVSPVKRWPGEVDLPDYMTFPQLEMWGNVLAGIGEDSQNAIPFYNRLIPVVCRIAVEWRLAGLPSPVTPETFPASPALAAWLVEAITGLFNETNEPLDPNSPEP